jgi:hypothetical protein
MWGIVLIAVAILGLSLMTTGVVAAGLFVLGYQRVKDAGKHKLRIAIKEIEVDLETGHMFFSIVVGLLMILAAGCVAGNRGEVAAIKERERNVCGTPRLEEGGYTICEETIRIDLRNRQTIGLIEHFGSDVSKTERCERIVIGNVGSGVKEVNLRHATSGPAIEAVEKLAGAAWRRITEKSEEFYNPFIELLRGRSCFKDLVARKGRMRSYYMSVPISRGRGQEIAYRLCYYNAFQGEDFEWAGKEVTADTDILTIHVVFPSDKPFKSFEAYMKDDAACPKMRIDDPNIEATEDRRALTWRIRDAKAGERFIIKWAW